jgi:hypothetical protein
MTTLEIIASVALALAVGLLGFCMRKLEESITVIDRLKETQKQESDPKDCVGVVPKGLLLPCPFCGQEITTLIYDRTKGYFVRCPKCFAQSRDVPFQQEDFKYQLETAWNSRIYNL